ncbi:MAG TPA: Gfo/Idh/MocA family oxidoreductase [Devosiaceae bacterium]|jgi:predicted dehydrogenase
MPKKTYRAGAIGHTGYGEYGHQLHMPYQFLPFTEMVAIADANPEGLKKGFEESKAQRSYSDYREMLAKENLDIVSVCPRQSWEHEAMLTAAIEAGCHIYVDKPLATSAEECDRIIALAEKHKVKIAVAHQSRHVEPFITAKQMLERGDIGTLTNIIGRGKEDFRGGGEDTMVLGCHVMDAMRFFAGDPIWVSGRVTAKGRDITKADSFLPAEKNGLIAGDSINATYAFPNGVVAQFQSHADMEKRGERWGITLIGTEGVLAIRYGDWNRRTTLKLSKAASVPEEANDFTLVDAPFEPAVEGSPDPATIHMPTRGNRRAIADLLDAAEQDRQPICSARDGRWAIEMVHGIYASHLSRTQVALPLANRSNPLAF